MRSVSIHVRIPPGLLATAYEQVLMRNQRIPQPSTLLRLGLETLIDACGALTMSDRDGDRWLKQHEGPLDMPKPGQSNLPDGIHTARLGSIEDMESQRNEEE